MKVTLKNSLLRTQGQRLVDRQKLMAKLLPRQGLAENPDHGWPSIPKSLSDAIGQPLAKATSEFTNGVSPHLTDEFYFLRFRLEWTLDSSTSCH